MLEIVRIFVKVLPTLLKPKQVASDLVVEKTIEKVGSGLDIAVVD
jgi:hypothetical protein